MASRSGRGAAVCPSGRGDGADASLCLRVWRRPWRCRWSGVFAGIAWQWRLAEAEKTRADAAAQHAMREADNARFQTASSFLIQGWSRAEQGDIAEGLLWITEALERTPETHPEFQARVRANLPAWEKLLVRMESVIASKDGSILYGLSPDGKTVLTQPTGRESLQARDARSLAGR